MADSFSAEAATLATAERWPRRYTVIILFALSTVLCYIDRVNISIAIIPLAHAKGYSDVERGLILSSFFWGYLWLQLPGGLLADRFGGKRVLGAGVADVEVEPLVPHATHFHARGARRGRLQASFKENVIDYGRVLDVMARAGYAGYVGVEYVWIDWQHCNEVDNLSETILLRDMIRRRVSV